MTDQIVYNDPNRKPPDPATYRIARWAFPKIGEKFFYYSGGLGIAMFDFKNEKHWIVEPIPADEPLTLDQLSEAGVLIHHKIGFGFYTCAIDGPDELRHMVGFVKTIDEARRAATDAIRKEEAKPREWTARNGSITATATDTIDTLHVRDSEDGREEHFGPITTKAIAEALRLRDADLHPRPYSDEDVLRLVDLVEKHRVWLKELDAGRSGAHATYSGGHHNDGHYDAFHHGMDTIYNCLDAHAERNLPDIESALAPFKESRQ